MSARTSLWLVALAAALVIAPGCKKKKDKERAEQQETEATKPTGPQRGGHLRLPSGEPRYLNPVLAVRANLANPLIFEGLIGIDAKLEPVPRLAESWDTSADGMTLTFKLREGVKWSDGEPFTSKDVKFTYDAIMATDEQTLWKAYLAPVESVTAPDDHLVVIKYKSTYGPALVTWSLGIIPEHVYGGEGALVDSQGNTEPVGTGPYTLSRWEKGRLILLEANDKWWYGRPYIDTIELVFDVQDAVGMLDRGELDFARVADLSDWSTTLQLPEFRERFEVSDVTESRFRTIAWNTMKKPFDDKRVRQALTMALNRERVIDEILLGQARPLSAPYFPTMFGADPSIAPRPFDVSAAVTLLDEAGLPSRDGRRFAVEMIALRSQQGPVADASMAIFRNNLRGIGIELEVDYLGSSEFFTRVASREYDAVYFGWLPDIPDPDPYALLHSSQIGSGANYAGFANPDVDQLLDEARATTDRGERKAIYQKLHKILHDEVPYTMLYAPFGHYAWSRRLRGVNPNDAGAQPRFPGIARWWIVSPETGAEPAPPAKKSAKATDG